MTNKKNIIDSHVHLDMIERHHPDRIQWLKENDCSVVSWSYFEGVGSVSELEGCLQTKAQCMRKHSAAGLVCHYLAGVHPRSIPPNLKPEQVGSLLKSYIEDPLCRGIGEIGLETGDAKEQEVFIAQLEFGRSLLSLGKIIGVHTPRSNKRPVTKTTLEILNRFPDLLSSLVVDHCTVKTIDAVLNAGFWAGVTLSPAKTSWEDMKHIVSICSGQIDCIMCNTDSGSAFYEDVVQFSRSDNLPETIREKLFYRNAARFFKIQ
jgi:predicted metal-dependent TIM-barrel fold hydrolase